MENPVYYVQYAHARIASIGRKAAEVGVARAPGARHVDSRRSCTSASSSCCARSRRTPSVLAEAAALRAPHRVTTWVRDFAKAFHGFYRDCRVISDDAALTQARLWLAEACRLGLAERAGHPRRAGARRDDAARRRRRRRVRAVNAARAVDGPLALGLLPRTASVDAAGRLAIDGCDLERSRREHGTPLYVYSETELRARAPRVPRRVR